MPSKYGGLADVGGVVVPGERVAGRARRGAASGRRRRTRRRSVRVNISARRRRAAIDLAATSLRRRPDVAQEDRACRRVRAERLVVAGRCRSCRPARRRRPAAARRGSSARTSGGSGPRSCGCPTARRRRPGPARVTAGDLVGQRAGVADAGRAAVARPGGSRAAPGTASARPRQVVGHDLRARARGSSSPTACWRRPRSTAFWASRPAATITAGLDVLVQQVMAAIATAPSTVASTARARSPCGVPGRAAGPLTRAGRRSSRLSGRRPGSAARVERLAVERHAVLRPPGPASTAPPSPGRVDVSRVAASAGRVVPQALLLGVGLDQRDLLVGAAGEAQVAQRLVVDREEARTSRRTRGHVGDRRPVGERQVAPEPGP